MKEIKVLILCGSRFAGPAIHALMNAKVLTAVAVPSLNDEAAEYAASVVGGSKIPVIKINEKDLENELGGIIDQYKASVCLILTFSQKIPASLFSREGIDFYNFHPGPLPLYRGPDPIFQQIKRREEYAGLVIHKIDGHFDTGPVIMKEKIKLNAGDTYGLITTKLGFLAAKMCGVLLKMISMGIDPPSRIQNESIAAYYKKQGSEDVKIDWNSMTADEISALVNACNPWNKGAVTRINYMVMRIPDGKKTTAPRNDGLSPGTIISLTENEMTVACINDEALSVRFVHLEEGFFSAGRLSEFGIAPGLRFDHTK